MRASVFSVLFMPMKSTFICKFVFTCVRQRHNCSLVLTSVVPSMMKNTYLFCFTSVRIPNNAVDAMISNFSSCGPCDNQFKRFLIHSSKPFTSPDLNQRSCMKFPSHSPYPRIALPWRARYINDVFILSKSAASIYLMIRCVTAYQCKNRD